MDPGTCGAADAPVLRYRAGRSPERIEVGGTPAWVASGYADVRAALGNPALSRERACAAGAPSFPGLFTPPPGTIVSRDGAGHAALRRVAEAAMARVATPGFAAGLARRAGARVLVVTDRLHEGGRADLIGDYCRPLAADVIVDLLGIPPEDTARFCDWVGRIADLSAGPDEQAIGALAGYVAALIQQRRTGVADDALGDLARAVSATAITEDEAVGLGFALIGGGFDSTQSLLGQIFELILGAQRTVWESVCGTNELGPAVIDELLRLTDVSGDGTTGLPRIATEPIRLGGRLIPQGEAVFVSVASANRDPGVFPTPDVLDPGRPGPGHLAFGDGIHRCLGEELVRLVIPGAVLPLAAAVPTLRVASAQGSCEWNRGTVNRSLRWLSVEANAGEDRGALHRHPSTPGQPGAAGDAGPLQEPQHTTREGPAHD